MVKRTGCILVISDRCFAGIEKDRSGRLLKEGLEGFGWDVQDVVVVPDEIPRIQDAIEAAVEGGCDLIVTSGSTGVSERDVAPEATADYIDVPLQGLSSLLMNRSLEQTAFAAFSRGLAGIHNGPNKTLIVNMPGSTKAAELFLGVVPPLLPHFYDQLGTLSQDQNRRDEGRYRDHPVG